MRLSSSRARIEGSSTESSKSKFVPLWTAIITPMATRGHVSVSLLILAPRGLCQNILVSLALPQPKCSAVVIPLTGVQSGRGVPWALLSP